MDHKEEGGKQPQPKKTGVAGFGSVADRAQDKEKTDKNNYYAGGHSSGMAVVGGPNNNEPHHVERLKAGAKQAGAVVDEHQKAEVPKFAGSGQSLSGVAVEGAPLPPKQVVRVLSMYDDGFTVDDGPFRPFADAANAAFLQDVEQGTVPRELEREAAQQGAQLQVDLVDKRGQKYEPPKNARPPVKAFVGSGHSLSAPPAQPPVAVAASTTTLVVDSSQPTTRVQFRGSDGSRVVGTFNETHTVAQCLSWLSSQRGGAAIRSASVAGPPARTLEAADYLLTLQQAQLKGAGLTDKHRAKEELLKAAHAKAEAIKQQQRTAYAEAMGGSSNVPEYAAKLVAASPGDAAASDSAPKSNGNGKLHDS